MWRPRRSCGRCEDPPPNAEIDDPPEREVDRPVPLQHAGNMRSDTSRVQQARVARQRVFDTGSHQLPQGPAEPSFFGRREAELIAAIAHNFRKNSFHCAAQDALRVAADDLVPVAETEAELDEAVIEEWDPRLDPMRHAVAVLPMQEHREI